MKALEAYSPVSIAPHKEALVLRTTTSRDRQPLRRLGPTSHKTSIRVRHEGSGRGSSVLTVARPRRTIVGDVGEQMERGVDDALGGRGQRIPRVSNIISVVSLHVVCCVLGTHEGCSKCGYDTRARQNAHRNNSEDETKRKVGYKYTGCLGHVDVTVSPDGVIHRLVGYLDHNEACEAAQCDSHPRIPLHPHVIDVAMRQFSEGAR